MKYYTEIVPFELAKKLKEAGYPQGKTTAFYNPNHQQGFSDEPRDWQDVGCISAPTYAEIFDWLLEKRLCVSVYTINIDRVYWISHLMAFANEGFDGSFGYKHTFNEAVNAAIEKALEILK